jgi:hypothetical protein
LQKAATGGLEAGEVWYVEELIARERQRELLREGEQVRMHRLAAAKPRTPAHPRRLRLFGRR